MTLFDRYIAVDWSAANTPRTGRDSIWIAESGRPSLNPPTRDEAMAIIRARLAEGGRVMLGFDFVFGYPRGAAEAITGVPRWDALWAEIAAHVVDRPDNSSNRFEVAAAFNRRLGADHYWGHPHQHSYADLAPTKPAHGYVAVPERRLAEALARSAQPVWKLVGAGAVGSQSLLGIARLEQLRRDVPGVAVWPFETDFERRPAPITLVEIYPSLFPLTGHVLPRDREQVETCVAHFAALDASGRLGKVLSAPADFDRAVLLAEEGWIAGVGHDLASLPLERAA